MDERIIVIGAGIAGLCTALALGPTGWPRFVRQTRLADRLAPRLRLALGGKF